jgi:hypothetical protein
LELLCFNVCFIPLALCFNSNFMGTSIVRIDYPVVVSSVITSSLLAVWNQYYTVIYVACLAYLFHNVTSEWAHPI